VIQRAFTPSEAISSTCAVSPFASPPWKVPFFETSTSASFDASPSAKRSRTTK